MGVSHGRRCVWREFDPHPVCALRAQADLPFSRGGEGERYFFLAASMLIGPPPEVAR
jgi:hypothetical protein